MADKENKIHPRQLAHVFHRPNTICVARAFDCLPTGFKLGLLAHECGHILGGPRAGEIRANQLAEDRLGLDIRYKDLGPGAPSVEWIPRSDYMKAIRVMGLEDSEL
jgi:hypothetical protein